MEIEKSKFKKIKSRNKNREMQIIKKKIWEMKIEKKDIWKMKIKKCEIAK